MPDPQQFVKDPATGGFVESLPPNGWLCPVCHAANVGTVCCVCPPEPAAIEDDPDVKEPTDLYEEHGEAGA